MRHAAIAGDEFLVGLGGTPAIVPALVLLRRRQIDHMAEDGRVVELEHRIGAVEPIRLGRQRNVVPGAEILDLSPADPGGGQAAGYPGRAQLFRDLEGLGPGFRRLVRVERRLLEGVLVPIHDRRRAVERHRQHLAVGGAVIAGDRRQVVLRVERLAGIGHQLIDRLHRALGGHHRRGADLEDLHDMRRVAGAEGGDRRGHRLGVGALEHRGDLVGGLRRVEVAGDLVDHLGIDCGHRMPPLQFDRLGRGRSDTRGENGRRRRDHDRLHVRVPRPSRGVSPFSSGSLSP